MFNSLSDLFSKSGAISSSISSLLPTSNLFGANSNGLGAPTNSSPVAAQQISAPQSEPLPSSDQMYQQVNDWIGGRSFDDIVKPYQDNSAAALNYAKQNHLEDFDTSQFGPGFGDRVDVKPGFSFIPVDGHDGKYLSFEHGFGWQGSDHDYVKVTRGPNGEALPVMTHHSSVMTPFEKLVAGSTIGLATAGFGQAAAGLAGAGAGSAGAAAGAEAGATASALPAGGMAATGTAAPWAAAGDTALGSGLYGTGTSAMGGLMGTSGGAFGLGSGLSSVGAADLAGAGGSSFLSSLTNKLGNQTIKSGLNNMMGGNGASTGGAGQGMDYTKLGGTLYDLYAKNQIADQLKGQVDYLKNMYAPGSQEAEYMRHQIEARDAAAGRRSQYGPREVELAGKLAQLKSQALTSPGFLNLQAAYLNNNASTGGLGQLFGYANTAGGKDLTGKISSGIGNIYDWLSKSGSGGSNSNLSDYIPSYAGAGDGGWSSGFDLFD